MSRVEQLRDAGATEAAGAACTIGLSDGAVIGLDGPMGAGKTTFARGFAKALGIDGTAVSSPSFTIVVEYILGDGRTFRHVDAWRLQGESSLAELGWDEWIGAPGTITLVEWACRIEAALPACAVRLGLDYDEASGRVLSIASGDVP